MQGVPIIVAQLVLLKIIIIVFLRDIHFLRINLHQLKVGFSSLFQCEIKLIHQMVNFLKPLYSSLPGGSRVGGHGIYKDSYIIIIIIIIIIVIGYHTAI